MGSGFPTPAILAIYRGSRTDGYSTIEFPTLADAIDAADLAVSDGIPDVLATVRDGSGILRYCVNSEGRRWLRGEGDASVAGWGRPSKVRA